MRPHLVILPLALLFGGRPGDTSVGFTDSDGDGFGAGDDCDGVTDEGDALDATTWYQDRDLDGYGDPALATVACIAPSGAIADGTDCADLELEINPAATELCDGVDNDCDGTADEDDAEDAGTWYFDADGDGWVTSAATILACSIPVGFADNAYDCDDIDSALNPGASEVCGDGIDNDCDGGPSGCGIQGDVDLTARGCARNPS